MKNHLMKISEYNIFIESLLIEMLNTVFIESLLIGMLNKIFIEKNVEYNTY